MILHQLFCHSDWGAFCNVKICGSRIKQLLQHWLHWQPFYKWNKHLIIRCEILDLTLFSTKDVGIKRAYILADFWHQPCMNSLQLFFFLFFYAIGNALQEVSMCFMNQEYLPRKINHFLLFGRPHLCIEPSLKRHTGDRWRHLEIQYLPHLLMSKHI